MGGAIKGLGSVAGGLLGGTAGASIGGALGGGLGSLIQGDPNAEGNAAYAEALRRQQQAYADQTFLDPEDYVAQYQEVDPEALRYFNPELETAEQLGDTQMAGVQLDPAFKTAQMEALARLSQRGQEGLTVSEEAARNEIMRNLETSNRGNQEAVLQNMARRGQLGGGAELAARMGAAQGEYSEAARQGEALAAQRDQRALQAALESGNLAGNMRGQEYGEKTDLAKARDAIAQFNLNQRAGVQQRNIGAKNVAGQSESDIRNTAYYQNLAAKNKQAEQLVGGTKAATETRNQAKLGAAGAGIDRASEQQRQGNVDAARKQGISDAFGNAITGGFAAYQGYKDKQKAASDARVKAGTATEEDWM